VVRYMILEEQRSTRATSGRGSCWWRRSCRERAPLQGLRSDLLASQGKHGDEVEASRSCLPPGRRVAPVSLYKMGDKYVVQDGNHRVSGARYQGIETIDAGVTGIRSPMPIRQILGPE
jgi:hypothetical protein